MYYQKKIHTPIGTLFLVATDNAIVSLDTFSTELFLKAKLANDHIIMLQAQDELDQYFRGTRTKFDTAIAPHGTAFQLEVWKSLQSIPFGNTLSYGEQALILQRPKAARAVGVANGKNPILIFIPCHRVCGHDGKLVGFSSGIKIKTKLLELEGHQVTAGKVIRQR
jgi:methylated-DNA-[protein]-cysteine S-methyltransferase